MPITVDHPYHGVTEISSLADAVESDHPCSDNNTCDIAAALDAGFVRIAAAQLLSATDEAHYTSAWVDRYRLNLQNDRRNRWNEWIRYFDENTVKCDECESYIYNPSEYGDTCGNCLADIEV